MKIGDPQRVVAITPSCRNRANPKSAIFSVISLGLGSRCGVLWHMRMFGGYRKSKITRRTRLVEKLRTRENCFLNDESGLREFAYPEKRTKGFG